MSFSTTDLLFRPPPFAKDFGAWNLHLYSPSREQIILRGCSLQRSGPGVSKMCSLTAHVGILVRTLSLACTQLLCTHISFPLRPCGGGGPLWSLFQGTNSVGSEPHTYDRTYHLIKGPVFKAVTLLVRSSVYESGGHNSTYSSNKSENFKTLVSSVHIFILPFLGVVGSVLFCWKY